MGLNEDEQREYDELCRQEHTLMGSPAVIDGGRRVIDLAADLDSERQHQ